jgi:manganese efflux pump family protein
MTLYEIFIIAFALALDAFAVAIAAGTFFGKVTRRQNFRLSFHFGLFQFLMPIIGWLCGSELVRFIADYDHWIAFFVLSAIGCRMIYNAVNLNQNISKDISRGWSLVGLSVATSLDALAVGFSLGIIQQEIVFPSIIIGLVASSMTIIGLKSGEKLSQKYGIRAQTLAGLVLIGIGIKIVFDHYVLV